MANVKVFVNKQTNGQAKNYMPLICLCWGIIIDCGKSRLIYKLYQVCHTNFITVFVAWWFYTFRFEKSMTKYQSELQHKTYINFIFRRFKQCTYRSNTIWGIMTPMRIPYLQRKKQWIYSCRSILPLQNNKLNPLPHMSIWALPIQQQIKNMMSKTKANVVQLYDWVENTEGKEKLLITSNFFFSNNVFKSCLLLMCQNEFLWSKGLKSSLKWKEFFEDKIDGSQFFFFFFR